MSLGYAGAFLYLFYMKVVSTIITLLFCQYLSAQTNYLYKVVGKDETAGYADAKGKVVIAPGKYQQCFTDTFKTYAIVQKEGEGWVAIDRNEKVLYHVFSKDNYPDYPFEGLFRIKENGLIGFADEATGAIVIEPKYKGAWQFENGQTRVSPDCEEKFDGYNHLWVGGQWFHINKKGERVD